jgi:hypothetical protein
MTSFHPNEKTTHIKNRITGKGPMDHALFGIALAGAGFDDREVLEAQTLQV